MQAGQFVETFHNINLLNLFGQVANEACRAGLSFPMILVMVSPSKELVYATEIGRHEGELRQRPLCGNLVPLAMRRGCRSRCTSLIAT
jgi:hypothetical protein